MIQRVYYRNQLNPELMMLQRLGKELYKYGYFIAGGSIWCAYRGLPINDIDIFSLGDTKERSLDGLVELIEQCAKSLGWTFRNIRGNVTKFTSTLEVKLNGVPRKIQFVNPLGKAKGTPIAVTSNFDILNCGCFIDAGGTVRHVNAYSYGNLLRVQHTIHRNIMLDTLVLGIIRDVPYVLKRIEKYVQRGLSRETVNMSQILTIQKALFLEQLLNEDFSEYTGEYESVSLESTGFTYHAANEYLKEHVKDYVKIPTVSLMQDQANPFGPIAW